MGRERCLIIAEMANTHGGSWEIAASLVRAAAKAGADAVKFQYFVAEDLVATDHPEYGLFKGFELPSDRWLDLVRLAHASGLLVLADVFSPEGARFMAEAGVDGFKVHSSDIGNLPLLRTVAALGRPVLVSAGAVMPRDVSVAVETLRAAGAGELAVLLGFQGFPTALEDCKLGLLPWYRREFGLPVGYADHVDGDSPMSLVVPAMAVALGAAVIEKHITYDRTCRPEDYEAALDPHGFEELVRRVRQAESVMGREGAFFSLSPAEKAYNRRMKKFPVFRDVLPVGTTIDERMLAFRRVAETETGYPADIRDLLGRRTCREVPAGRPIRATWLEVRVAILIAVRLTSTRLPRKSVVDVAGKPALVRLVERLKRVQRADEIVLCTTCHSADDPLVDLAGKMGLKVFRGPEEDVMARFLGAARMVGADHIVRVTGDDILRDPEYIDRAIEFHLGQNAEYTSVAGLPYGVDSEVISVRALAWAHEHACDPSRSEYLTWYLDNPAYFRTATLQADPRHRRPDYRLTLDTPEDLALMRAIFRSLGPERSDFPLDDIIKLLDERPDLVRINAGVAPKLSRDQIDTRMRAL